MFETERFVEDCRAALRDQSPLAAVNEVVQRAVLAPGEIEQALGSPAWGGITVLHRSRELTILNVIWTPGMRAEPHNHCMWAAIGVYGGREDNAFFRRREHGLDQLGERKLGTGETLTLGEHGIHSVHNSQLRFTGGLHVYGGDFFAADRRQWDPVTFEERAFDREATLRIFAEANERWAVESEQSKGR